MITIIFESHGTSFDNEANLSSGHNDVELSPLGLKQAKELGERYKDANFDVIFCSDLRRSYKTGELAFGEKYQIVKDVRLRECDYGDLTKHPSSEVEPVKKDHLAIPFPNGESYENAAARMKSFLEDILRDYNEKKIMIIGHRATQYGLDLWIKGKPLQMSLADEWHWQPGWTYHFEKINEQHD